MKRITLLTILLLAGCNSGGESDYGQFYRAMRQGFAASFGKGHVSKAQAAAIPYASMGYRVNDGAQRLIVLATDSNSEQLWTSATHIVIVTHDGRIVRTVGLAYDVSAVTPQGSPSLPAPAVALKNATSSTRLEDFPDLSAYGVPVRCTARAAGGQTIVILGSGITTLRVNETCRSDSLDWSFTDSYWLDPKSGLTWRSIQHISPKGEKIETEILRPPG